MIMNDESSLVNAQVETLLTNHISSLFERDMNFFS